MENMKQEIILSDGKPGIGIRVVCLQSSGEEWLGA